MSNGANALIRTLVDAGITTCFTNFSADIAFCECLNTLEALLEKVSARRLLLGTCTPLLSTRGEVDKLRCAKIPAKAQALIGTENARRFFKL